jgi:hypothetical protein
MIPYPINSYQECHSEYRSDSVIAPLVLFLSKGLVRKGLIKKVRETYGLKGADQLASSAAALLLFRPHGRGSLSPTLKAPPGPSTPSKVKLFRG